MKRDKKQVGFSSQSQRTFPAPDYPGVIRQLLARIIYHHKTNRL